VQSAAAVTRAIAAVSLPLVPAGMATTVAEYDLGSLDPLDHVNPHCRQDVTGDDERAPAGAL
jgi:hypothetical protein